VFVIQNLDLHKQILVTHVAVAAIISGSVVLCILFFSKHLPM